MIDPITLLFGASFAAVFVFALGLDIGFKMGSRTRPANRDGLKLEK